MPLARQWKANLTFGVSSLRRVTFYRKKVTKVLPRGDPLGIPKKQKGSLFIYFRHSLIEMANRLPRSPAPAVIFGSLCLYFGVPNWKAGAGRPLHLQGTPKKRQKAVIYNRVAGERGKRNLFPGGCADNRKKNDRLFKAGRLKPKRFQRRFAYFLDEEKVGRRRPTPTIE